MSSGFTASLQLSKELICAADVSSVYVESGSGSYALIGYHGQRTFGGTASKRGFASCGIVHCTQEKIGDLSSCGKDPNKGLRDHSSSKRKPVLGFFYYNFLFDSRPAE